MADKAKIARLAEIQDQIEALIDEGVRIAEEQKVTFDLGDTQFAAEYGMGGYRYVPEDSKEAEERRECEYYEEFDQHGWLNSSSDCN